MPVVTEIRIAPATSMAIETINKIIGTINFNNVFPTTLHILPKLLKPKVKISPYEKLSFLFYFRKLITSAYENGTVTANNSIAANGIN